MAIEDLLAVVPAPSVPIDTVDRWEEVQERLGIRLPSDLREFGKHYGTGRFSDDKRLHLLVFNPLGADYFDNIDHECNLLRESRDDDDDVPYPIFPENGGILPWGTDDNGSKMYGLTGGDAESWPTLVNPPRYSEYQRFDVTMTTFLAKAFRRELQTTIWNSPRLFTPPGVSFEPTRHLNRIVLE